MEVGVLVICDVELGVEEGVIGGFLFWIEEKFSLGVVVRDEVRFEFEEEVLFGFWFWDRDEVCFDLNFIFVYIVKSRYRDLEEDFNLVFRFKIWDEVIIEFKFFCYGFGFFFLRFFIIFEGVFGNSEEKVKNVEFGVEGEE